MNAYEETLGWVVLERNQASGMAEVLDFCSIFDDEQEAAELAATEEAQNRKHGRREHYSIAKLVEVTYA